MQKETVKTVIYTISDLHLPLGIDKPMDIFGKAWTNYVERIRENWLNTVKDNDIVILPGDFSWATYLDQATADFSFIHNLPGKKILLKGNHDYWWETLTKLNKYIASKEFSSISFLHNNSYVFGNIGICGTRGWSIDAVNSEEDKKMHARETMRLRASLDSAFKNGAERLFVFTHYPPVSPLIKNTEFSKVLTEYGVEKCVYGHLHGIAHRNAFTGDLNGTEYILAAGDYTGFMPIKLAEINDIIQ